MAQRGSISVMKICEEFLHKSERAAQAPLRFNVYGYNISGPMFFPKIYPKSKSRTFFFFNQEWRKLWQATIFGVRRVMRDLPRERSQSSKILPPE